MKTLDIAFRLYAHYEQTEEINNYYGLLALYGLAQAAFESGDEKWISKCRGLLGRYPDGMEHPHYNFCSYRLGGNASAWAAMKGMYVRKAGELEKYADQTMAGEKEKHGILCMPGRSREGWIWIDEATAITPFMLFAGVACGREAYIDFAAEQCMMLYEHLIDPACGLLHQCKGFLENHSLCSEDHWSRGNGWGYLALAELVQYLPPDSRHREKAIKYYESLSEAVLPFQTDRGLWRQEMTEKTAWEESSGTALILYGIGIGLRIGLLPENVYKDVFVRGLEGILEYGMNQDFSTELSCPGCLCPGEGDRRGTINAYITEKHPVRDEHHSFGAYMLALVEAHSNGILEIDLQKGEPGDEFFCVGR